MILYDRIVNISKIERVYHDVRLTTKHKQKIINFNVFYLTNIMQIYEILRLKKYKHGAYNVFLVKEYKYRLIMSENISDKIVNHLISNEILLPLIEPRLIETNVATRKNKGIKMGLFYIKKYINNIRRTNANFYVLKCDIKKYFYNIDHEILLNMLKRFLPDNDVLDVLRDILETTNSEDMNNEINKVIEAEKQRLIETHNPYLAEKFAELDSIPRYHLHKGLPIGNMTSQILAIFYLNDLDHYIKEKLHIKYYVRYMDDLVLFHEDKEYLKECLDKINVFLKEKCALTLHPKKTRIYPFKKEGLNFLGYRFIIKNNRLITLMCPETKKKIKAHLKYVNHRNPPNKRSVYASYKGYFNNCKHSSFVYRNAFFDFYDI